MAIGSWPSNIFLGNSSEYFWMRLNVDLLYELTHRMSHLFVFLVSPKCVRITHCPVSKDWHTLSNLCCVGQLAGGPQGRNYVKDEVRGTEVTLTTFIQTWQFETYQLKWGKNITSSKCVSQLGEAIKHAYVQVLNHRMRKHVKSKQWRSLDRISIDDKLNSITICVKVYV